MSKLSSALFCLRNCKNFLSDNALKTLYFSIFHCHLIYALLAWGTANKTALEPVIKKQKNAVRIVARAAYNAHTEPLFKKLEILRFEDLYVSNQLQFVRSYQYGKLPHSFDGTWVLNKYHNPATAGLRIANKLFEPNPRIKFTARLPLHSFPKLLSKLG